MDRSPLTRHGMEASNGLNGSYSLGLGSFFCSCSYWRYRYSRFVCTLSQLVPRSAYYYLMFQDLPGSHRWAESSSCYWSSIVVARSCGPAVACCFHGSWPRFLGWHWKEKERIFFRARMACPILRDVQEHSGWPSPSGACPRWCAKRSTIAAQSQTNLTSCSISRAQLGPKELAWFLRLHLNIHHQVCSSLNLCSSLAFKSSDLMQHAAIDRVEKLRSVRH